jgi:hypothetical protein
MRRIGDRFVIAMFHPAAALHQAALKPAILADFAKLPQQLEVARRELAKLPVHTPAVAPVIAEEKPGQAQITHTDDMPAQPPKQLKLF